MKDVDLLNQGDGLPERAWMKMAKEEIVLPEFDEKTNINNGGRHHIPGYEPGIPKNMQMYQINP